MKILYCISGTIAVISIILAVIARLFFVDKALFGISALAYLRFTNTMLLFTISFLVFGRFKNKKFFNSIFKFIRDKVSNIIIGLVIGLVVGIVASYLGSDLFWRKTLGLVPDIKIDLNITQDGKMYKIPVFNNGPRNAIDVRINAELLAYLNINDKSKFFKNKQAADSNDVILVPLSTRTNFLCVPFKKKNNSQEYMKDIMFTLNDSDFIHYMNYFIDSTRSNEAKELYQQIKQQRLCLEEVFVFFDTLRVTVVARDEISQNSKVFIRKFTKNDIKKGESL